MKRDMKIIRSILESIESKHKIDDTKLPEELFNAIGYVHIHLAEEGGLIESTSGTSSVLDNWYRLTWKGYEYLDALREKDVMKSKGLG